MLVGFYFLVGLHDAQIDPRCIQFRLLFVFVAFAQQVEMITQELCRLFDTLFFSFLIVEQTELQGCVCLRLHVAGFHGDVKHIQQVLDGLADVASFRVSLCQLLVRLSSGCLVFVLLTQLEEVQPIFD